MKRGSASQSSIPEKPKKVNIKLMPTALLLQKYFPKEAPEIPDIPIPSVAPKKRIAPTGSTSIVKNKGSDARQAPARIKRLIPATYAEPTAPIAIRRAGDVPAANTAIKVKVEPIDPPTSGVKVKAEHPVPPAKKVIKPVLTIRLPPDNPVPRLEFQDKLESTPPALREKLERHRVKAAEKSTKLSKTVSPPPFAKVKQETPIQPKTPTIKVETPIVKPEPLVKTPEYVPFSILERYTPKKLSDVVGQSKALSELKAWITAFKARRPGIEPAVLLSGPPGIGKTTIAHLMLKEYGYRVTELNASEDRSRALIVDKLLPALTVAASTLFGRPTGVVLDEIDGMTGDNGGLGAVVAMIRGEYDKFRKDQIRAAVGAEAETKPTLTLSSRKAKEGLTQRKIKEVGKKTAKPRIAKAAMVPSSPTPVICIANVSYSKKMVSLKNVCKEIKFSSPTMLQQRELIEKVLIGEGFEFEPGISQHIAKAIGSSDFRHILVELGQWLRFRPASLGRTITLEEAKALSVAAVDKDSQSIFGCATRLLTGGLKLEESLVTLSADPFKISSMMMQSYPDFLPRAARQNKTEKQIAQNQFAVTKRLQRQAELYSQCDLFESYSHHGQVCTAYGTSVLAGAPLEPGLLKADSPVLQTMSFPEFALSRARQAVKRLPLRLRHSVAPEELGLIRFKLPTASAWDKKNSAAKAEVQSFLGWTEHYHMEFTNVENLNNLTSLGPTAKDEFVKLKHQPRTVAFGGRGKTGLKSLMRAATEISAAELDKLIDQEDDEEEFALADEI